jgi:hypothetical protein
VSAWIVPEQRRYRKPAEGRQEHQQQHGPRLHGNRVREQVLKKLVGESFVRQVLDGKEKGPRVRHPMKRRSESLSVVWRYPISRLQGGGEWGLKLRTSVQRYPTIDTETQVSWKYSFHAMAFRSFLYWLARLLGDFKGSAPADQGQIPSVQSAMISLRHSSWMTSFPA